MSKKEGNKNPSKFEREKPLIVVGDNLWEVLDKLQDNPITWSIMDLDRNPLAINTMRVEEIDLGDKEYRINCKIAGKFQPIKLSAFIRNFFGYGQFDQAEIDDFVDRYNKLMKGKEGASQGKLIEKKPFQFDPTNVKETFLSLVTETYPHGHEEEVVPFITPGLSRDGYGNYYTVIGESDTVFTCHLDTASRQKNKINLVSFEKDGDEFIVTDKTSILGADDKAGVTVLMYMIANNIPGVYWFFIGEERGGLGSKYVSNNIQNYPFMTGKTKCVSFDRRNYFSVITKQMGLQCCSNKFAEELCAELNSHGMGLSLDPTGVFTDSANFMEQIPECTNISVGYFNEHTVNEIQNISYLERLCEAAVNCNWASLKPTRKLEADTEAFKKYSRLAKELKTTTFYNFDTMRSEDEKFIFEMEVTDIDFEHLDTDLFKLNGILRKYSIDPNTKLRISKNTISIELD